MNKEIIKIDIKTLNNEILSSLQSVINNNILYSIIGEVSNIFYFKENCGLSLNLTDNKHTIICKLWNKYSITEEHCKKYDNLSYIKDFDNKTCIVTGHLKTEYFNGKYTIQIIIKEINIYNDRSIIETLMEECVKRNYYLNKKIIEWNNVKTIGILSKKNSQGLNDFYSQLNIPLKIILKQITLEGDETENELIKHINYFNTKKNVDVIIIVRGGGSTIDISKSYDKLTVFESIKNSIIPIITAIGHEADKNNKLLINNISDLNFATPSSAALEINNIYIYKLLNFINDTILNLKLNLQHKKNLQIYSIYKKIKDEYKNIKNKEKEEEELIINIPQNYKKDYFVIKFNNLFYKINIDLNTEINIENKQLLNKENLNKIGLKQAIEKKNIKEMQKYNNYFNNENINSFIKDLIDLNKQESYNNQYFIESDDDNINIISYNYYKCVLENQDSKKDIYKIYNYLTNLTKSNID